ncbi:protein AGENET DOMAIN (AGD)-CONTAINING P1-like [Rosa sericea]
MPRKPRRTKVFNFSKCLTPGLVPMPETPPPSPPREELIEEVGENDPVVTDSTVSNEIFTKGALVEVSSDEEGFHGSWFAATVVKSVGKDKFLIEYKCLRTEDDSAFLREEVDNMHIRPHPPENVVDRFKQLDEVDALYNDGWWVGVISKVLRGSKYIVYFKETCEELEYQHSELRLHQDWIDGKWVIPSRELKL